MKSFEKKRLATGTIFMATVLAVGLVSRLVASSFGYTYDLESYTLVGDLVTNGQNVYASTSRYNYGPVWMYVVGFIYKISQYLPYSFVFFRFGIAALLSVVDIGIFFVLVRAFGLSSGLFYYLNPLTIILTGFNSQFDNIAILPGLVASFLLKKSETENSSINKLYAFMLFGVSLVVKHIFLFYPIWLFFREKNWKGRILAIVIPYGMFGLSFLPFIKDGALGILNNVFFYVSFKNAPLWNFLILNGFPRIFSEFTFFVLAMLAGALVFRKKNPFHALLLYTMVLVIFSPAIADQYFTIVLPFISVFPNVFFIMFVVVQFVYTQVVIAGGEMYSQILGRTLDKSAIGYHIQILLLLAGSVYALFRIKVSRWGITQWIRLLAILNIAFLFLFFIPGYVINNQAQKLEKAITRGDYEYANALYVTLEKKGILAGSVMWNRLARARYYVMYYRAYQRVRDIFPTTSSVSDWENLVRTLEGMPSDFAYKDTVFQMLETAHLELEKYKKI